MQTAASTWCERARAATRRRALRRRARWRPARRRELETFELEARRHRAADQRPVAETLRRLPDVSRHDRLRALATGKVGPQRHAVDGIVLIVRDLEPERRSGVVMPCLDRIDP